MTDEEMKVSFADLLAGIRKRRDLARKALARKLYVSPSLIANYENRYQPITLATIDFIDKLTHHLELNEEEAEALFNFRVEIVKVHLTIDNINAKALEQMEYEADVSIKALQKIEGDLKSGMKYGVKERLTLVLLAMKAYRRILIIALLTGNLTPYAIHGAFQNLQDELSLTLNMLSQHDSTPPSQTPSQD